MGLLSEYLPDFLPEDPNKREAAKMGLLSFGASMLANATKGFGGALGNGLLSGVQGYQDTQNSQFQNDYRNAQMGHIKTKADQDKQKQAAYSRISSGYEADPAFKPSMADLLVIDPDSAMKGMMPGGAVDYGLEPKVGINPQTGKQGYFIQDKRGGTKWIDAAVPPNLQYIKGDDYRPGQVFDARSGTMVAPGGQQGGFPATAPASMPANSPYGAPAAPQAAPVDTLAPWSKLTSPREQDQLRAKVYSDTNKRLDELRQRVSQGRETMKDLERFAELNRMQATGGWLDQTDLLHTTDTEKKEMEAITARLAPSQRPVGSGTTSDKDIGLYLQGLPGIDKKGDVNRNIRMQFSSKLKDAEEMLTFQELYKNDKGHLNGVEAAYELYKKNGGKQPAQANAAPMAPSTNTQGGWDTINSSTRTTQPARDAEKLAILKAELAEETDPTNRAALEREIKRAGGTESKPEAKKQNAFSDLPPPVKYKGKVATDQETGKRYRSDGLKWLEVK